ncbi:MAG: radical SAM protein [Armatimonadetes bacterium]|nr:radical SAM protein [Armatimonadota bacterium]
MSTETYRHIFGPVPSRRLGRSLGIDLVPLKTCTFDCVYCQLGRTTHQTLQRRPYFPAQAVISELQRWLETGNQADYLTLSGSGEPTLNSQIGEVIKWATAHSEIPVAVLTNGSLLWDGQVQSQLSQADLLIPSLDAALPASFERVNRPCPGLDLDRIVEGLAAMRKEFKGEFWLEVMLVEGLNTSDEDLKALAEAIARIEPDRVQLGTVVRPPAEAFARPVSAERLQQAREILGPVAEIIGPPSSAAAQAKGDQDLAAAILELLRRRPCTLTDIAAGLGVHPNEAAKYVDQLIARGLVEVVRQNATTYLRGVAGGQSPHGSSEKAG